MTEQEIIDTIIIMSPFKIGEKTKTLIFYTDEDAILPKLANASEVEFAEIIIYALNKISELNKEEINEPKKNA